MLPDSLDILALRSFAKVDADPTLYKDEASPRGLPATISVQHSAGKGGSPIRHLIQIRRPIKDATNAYTGEYATVNMTITYPNTSYGSAQVDEAVMDLIGTIADYDTGIVASAVMGLVLEGHN